MSPSPRDSMEQALEELKRNANLMSDALGQILEAVQEDKAIPEDVLRYAARMGRRHEDWIGLTVRRAAFYPKGWKDE